VGSFARQREPPLEAEPSGLALYKSRAEGATSLPKAGVKPEGRNDTDARRANKIPVKPQKNHAIPQNPSNNRDPAENKLPKRADQFQPTR
jgi:hypothetical protein